MKIFVPSTEGLALYLPRCPEHSDYHKNDECHATHIARIEACGQIHLIRHTHYRKNRKHYADKPLSCNHAGAIQNP